MDTRRASGTSAAFSKASLAATAACFVCLPINHRIVSRADYRNAPQSPQNPSPMVEHTRSHPRLKQESPAGKREPLEIGTLFVPAVLDGREKLPLLVHFHGAPWIPEFAAARHGKLAVITAQLGAGSSVYAKAFADSNRFSLLVAEAERKSGVKFDPVMLSAWSAGYGAVREILRDPANYERVSGLLMLDGLHTGYVGGKPGPLESQLETDKLEIFLKFARHARDGSKKLIITHTEIFPGTFASTTETADYLIRELELRRTPILKWGPMGTQQLSQVCVGQLQIAGFAGNSAPDHIDQLHALPDFLFHLWPTQQRE